MYHWTESVIRRLKRDTSYTLDKDISAFDLIEVLLHRGIAIIRGFWIRPQLKKSAGLLFLGKQTTLKHKRKIILGKSNIIEDYVHLDALSKNGIVFGNNVTVAKFTTIQCTGVIRELGVGIEIGDNSAVGAYSFLGAHGGIKIGNNVIMGPRVGIHSENHTFQDRSIPIRAQKTTRKGVIIDDDCWIGASSTILDGVHIHTGCVVAAGSVVTKDVPPHSVVAGVPARWLKNIGENNIQ